MSVPRLLIVDDDADNRGLFALVLEHEGYVVTTADGGAEALAMLAANPVDLVLLDIMMPGMTGYEVAIEIRATPSLAATRIVMMTALDGNTVREQAFAAGAEDVLHKPLDRAQLCGRVKALLELGGV